MHDLNLLDNNGNLPNISGLNWGQNSSNHTRRDDAYIAIRADDIRNTEHFFSPLSMLPSNVSGGREQRNNDPILVSWDDGTQMRMLFEGVQNVDGQEYPKQLCSFPEKNTLGKYLRDRIGISHGTAVLKGHLNTYGRTSITIGLSDHQIPSYTLDFRVR